MKFIVIPVLLLSVMHPLSYAAYNWRKKNRLGAVGMILLAVTAFVLPSVLLILR